MELSGLENFDVGKKVGFSKGQLVASRMKTGRIPLTRGTVSGGVSASK